MWIIHRHVQPRAEEVLVNLSVEAWGHQGSVGRHGALSIAEAIGAQAARQLCLELNRAILHDSS